MASWAHNPLFRTVWATVALAMALTALVTTSYASTMPPASVVAVPGKPVLLIGAYDLGDVGYRADEYFISGTATAYALPGPAKADGVWNAAPASTAKYTTRVVVLRPADPIFFNGTVLVEWLNVTAGQDTPADWMVAHREMIRKGYAWVGVSAQQVGVEGGDAIMGQGMPLKKTDPARYGTLSHPGDAYSYDIFSQAGAAVKGAAATGLLGPLAARRVLAIGESQSAAFLTTYVNAIDPLAQVYDGFLIHSRFGSSAALDGLRPVGPGGMPAYVHFRPDLRVPLLTVITETDLLGGPLPGYHAARVPDNDHLRVWEVAGAAHADNYLFAGAFIDSGLKPATALAHIFVPSTTTPAGKLAQPANPGLPHHYVVEAAIAALNSWVHTGVPPAHSPLLVLASGGTPGSPASLARDGNGLAEGGIRTPWVEVPTVRLSGAGDPGSLLAMLVGSGEPFDAATLARLYPGGKADYLRKCTQALDAAIAGGFILPDDRDEILEIAGINFDKAG
jgi:hypothetical protein